MVVACPDEEAEGIRGSFPKYFRTNFIRNELDWEVVRPHSKRNSPTPLQSWTQVEDGKKGKKTKIKLVLGLEPACGSINTAALSPRPRQS